MSDTLQQFFVYNHIIILFVYGQVFFVMGLAIALQSWQHSRLSLARALPWLAIFGFTHGLHEWGDVFIPIQTAYLPNSAINILIVVQLLLLAISFVGLFQYGIESLRPLPGRWRLLRYLPLAIFSAWILYLFLPDFTLEANISNWARTGDIYARYSMGLPGGLLAAYGLQRTIKNDLTPHKVQYVIPMVRLMQLGLIGYGIMGGLIVPAGPFFPANVLNQELVQRITSLPIQVYRSLLGLILMYATIRMLDVFHTELEFRLANIEESQILLAERERIGRELHDGTLQAVYAAGLILRTAERDFLRDNIKDGASRLQQGIAMLDQSVTDIRRYIGALKPQPTTKSLAAGLTEIAHTFHNNFLLQTDLNLDMPADLILSPVQVSRLLAIANEAMSNVARHAEATTVLLSTVVRDGWLFLTIKDNGKGLPVDVVQGYGLNNIRDRARLLGGILEISSAPNQGTRVVVKAPIGDSYETTAYLTGG